LSLNSACRCSVVAFPSKALSSGATKLPTSYRGASGRERVPFNSDVKLPGGGPLLMKDFAVAKLAVDGARPSLLGLGGASASLEYAPVLGPVGRVVI
jgi:hypothetical protein